MRQARPEGYSPKKSVLEAFEALGGEQHFLKRLVHHPALKIIERLDKEEAQRARLTAKLAQVNETLDQMEAILQKKMDKALEKLPARAQILIAKLRRKPLSVKALR